jgi:hypothetical protein
MDENNVLSLEDCIQINGDQVTILFPDEEDTIEITLDYNTIRIMAKEPVYCDVYADTEDIAMFLKELLPEVNKIVEEKRRIRNSAGK